MTKYKYENTIYACCIRFELLPIQTVTQQNAKETYLVANCILVYKLKKQSEGAIRFALGPTFTHLWSKSIL